MPFKKTISDKSVYHCLLADLVDPDMTKENWLFVRRYYHFFSPEKIGNLIKEMQKNMYISLKVTEKSSHLNYNLTIILVIIILNYNRVFVLTYIEKEPLKQEHSLKHLQNLSSEEKRQTI